MEDEDFLAAIEADNAAVPVEEPKEEAETPQPEVQPEQPKDERQRDEHGRFAPKADPGPVQEPAPEPVRAETPPPPPPEPHAPITALLDEREKRQNAERELQALRQQFAAQQQPVEIPDPDMDPVGYAQFQDQQVKEALYLANRQWSERIAVIQHGQSTVAEAKTWGIERCNTDPYFNAQVRASPDPLGFVVDQWKRDQLVQKVSDPSDFDAFLAWKAAQTQMQQQQAAPAAPPNPAPAIPPRSLASAPSAGGVSTEVAQTEEEIFAEVIPKG